MGLTPEQYNALMVGQPACEICGRGPAQGVNLYRANGAGVKELWRCDLHHNAESFLRSCEPANLALAALANAMGNRKTTLQ